MRRTGRSAGHRLLVCTLIRRRNASCHSDERRSRGDRRARVIRRRPISSGEKRPRWGALPGRPPPTMPLPRLIPCLDVAGGRVVKGVRFRELRDVGDPVELGAAYSDGGADELVFLDISASIDDKAAAVEVAARVAEQVTIPFTFGGGI